MSCISNTNSILKKCNTRNAIIQDKHDIVLHLLLYEFDFIHTVNPQIMVTDDIFTTVML